MGHGLWVSQVFISRATAHKIRTSHGRDPEEIRDAIGCRPGLSYVWHHHPDRGVRALVTIQIRRQRVLVVLYPERSDPPYTSNLGSAYRI